jgi:hypothetical protein
MGLVNEINVVVHLRQGYWEKPHWELFETADAMILEARLEFRSTTLQLLGSLVMLPEEKSSEEHPLVCPAIVSWELMHLRPDGTAIKWCAALYKTKCLGFEQALYAECMLRVLNLIDNPWLSLARLRVNELSFIFDE